MKLTIELVPSTAWYSNVRSNVTTTEWDVLRKECYKKAGYKCEVCAGKGPNHPVECHEIWEYDDDACTQTLEGLIALCPDCHSTKHFGFARVSGKEKEAKLHLMKVNDLTEEQADKYIEEVFMIWEQRSKYDWTLDISFLNKYE